MIQGIFHLLFSNLNLLILQPLAHLLERLGMANILRTIVSGPRQRHAEAGLDLCYVTPNIVVTSGPSSTYPARAYRNPTDALVRWLDEKHGSEWMIWEFRAEGTGYPDDEVYGRVRHYPWPDHHPPPFRLIPAITAGMRNWLQEDGAKEKGRTVVVHCKAGKGRSGTVATSYLVSQEGWEVKDALNRFTQRRMRPGFGAGVSIPSQVRWVGYVDRWTKGGKKYVERRAVVQEVHVWGLREGVKVSVDGFVEEGKKIKAFHTFEKNERLVVDGSMQNGSVLADLAGSSNDTKVAAPSDVLEKRGNKDLIDDSKSNPSANPNPKLEKTSSSGDDPGSESGGRAVIFRPKGPITLETSDICIDFERRNRAKYGWTMVTSVAHVWFNVFFEGLAAQEQDSEKEKENDKADVLNPPKSGVFNIEWDAMDGIKGTSRKGIRAFDRLAVVWAVEDGGDGDGDGKEAASQLVLQPAPGEPVPESKAADWRGSDTVVENGDEGDNSESSKTTISSLGLGTLTIDAVKGVKDKDLGLRTESPSSANISKANSVRSEHKPVEKSSSATATATQQMMTTEDSVFEGIRSHSNPDQDQQSGENSPASGKSRYENVDESGIDLNNGSKLAAAVDKARAIAGHATGSTS